MQPRRLLSAFAVRVHGWLIISLLLIRPPRFFTAKKGKQSCLPAGWSPACTGPWGYSSQVQDSAFLLVELCEIPLCPILQPVQLPSNGSTTLSCISHSSQLLSSMNLPSVCVVPTLMSLMMRLDSIGIGIDPCGT